MGWRGSRPTSWSARNLPWQSLSTQRQCWGSLKSLASRISICPTAMRSHIQLAGIELSGTVSRQILSHSIEYPHAFIIHESWIHRPRPPGPGHGRASGLTVCRPDPNEPEAMRRPSPWAGRAARRPPGAAGLERWRLPRYLITQNSCQTYVCKSTIPASLQEAAIRARQSASDLMRCK